MLSRQIRGPQRDEKRHTQRKHGLTHTQNKAIDTCVLRTRAENLESLLRLKLVTFEEADIAEQETLPEEYTEEDPDNDPFESTDVDDLDADSEGDASEGDESTSPLDAFGVDTPQRYDHRVDVVVECVIEEGASHLIVYSGISDLMFHLGHRDMLTSAYHRFLCQRVADTMVVARCIVDANLAYFSRESEKPTLLRRDELITALGVKKDRLSRLLTSASLLTPWNEKIQLRNFITRSVASTTDVAFLQVFAEHIEEDMHSPLSDRQLAEYTNVLLQHRKPLGRTAINEARKRLGIPKADSRKSRYVLGMSIVDMVSEGEGTLERMESFLRIIEQVLPHLRNEGARETAQQWRKEALGYLQRR